MKVKIIDEFDIPASVASLLLGANVDPSISNSDFTIQLDSEGAKRFSTILHMIYQNEESTKPASMPLNNIIQMPQKQQQQDIPIVKENREILSAVETSSASKSTKSMSSLRDRAKKFNACNNG